MGFKLIASLILILSLISFGDSCDSDSECQTEDENKICFYFTCSCRIGYSVDVLDNNKCKDENSLFYNKFNYKYSDNFDHTKYNYSYDYTCVWIWIAIVVTFNIAIVITICWTRKRERNPIVLRTNQQPYTIFTIDGHGSNTYQTSHEINIFSNDQFLSNQTQSFNYPPPPYSIKYDINCV